MIGKLRRNVIMRDWYDETEYFYHTHGYDIRCAAMNIKTLDSMMYYLNKNPKYGYIGFCHDYIGAQDGCGHVVAQFHNNTTIMFRGVEIIIDNDMENEQMKIW